MRLSHSSNGTKQRDRSTYPKPDRSAHDRRHFLKALSTGAAAMSTATTPVAEAISAPHSKSGGAIFVKSFRRTAHGVRIDMSMGVLEIIAQNARIVRVLYVPGRAQFSVHTNLAVVKKPESIPFQLHATRAHIRLSTALITVQVRCSSGALTFFDSSGQAFLAEPLEGGKFMRPTTFKGVPAFEVRQAFYLPVDEALYGLGQHQQGIMNYHGSIIRLEQSNRHIAVPIMVSNYGYGIFWNNPAITEVSAGASNPQPIAAAYLVDSQGKHGGLTIEYFSDMRFRNRIRIGTDATLKISPQNRVVGGIPALSTTRPYSVRWTGWIKPPVSGGYTFTGEINGSMQLAVGGEVIIDCHDERPNTSVSARLELTKGRRYRFTMQYIHHAERSEMKLRWSLPPTANERHTLSWQSQVGGAIDYYILYGPSADEVISAWRGISGTVPMLGRWVWGFWQSKCLYKSQAEILGIAAQYRSLNIPIDGIVQDLFYWRPAPWGSNRFNPRRYPSPAGMVRTLHREHVHFMLSVWAQFAPGSSNYRRLLRAGLLYPSRCRDRYYDAFNPLARRLYWQFLKLQLFSLGVDAWWLDASEPQLCNDWGQFAHIKTHLGWGAFVYNAYPLMHTTAVYEGQRQTTSQKRIMILTRSAWAGQQRNSTVVWSGDIPATWRVLREQIPAGINFSLTGIPYWNSDIGGFFSGNPQDPAYRELFIRWFQFGAFCPLFRVHGANYPKEMWRFGPEAMQILLKFDQLRYRLLPYIYSVSWMVSQQGYTMMRGLMMDFGSDPAVLSIPDQYFFGPALMVSPVLEARAASRNVYLPQTRRWFDFWTGTLHPGGGTIVVQAGLDSMPLQVPAGAIVLLGPLIHRADLPADPLEVRIYSGADAAFTLYEDENDNYNYERGTYSEITFHWLQRTRTLTIGDRKGAFPGMLRHRRMHIVLVRAGHGVGIVPTAAPDHLVHYSGRETMLSL